MAIFVLNRNHRIISMTGHSVVFKKGEETFVPDVMIPEVVALGGERVDIKQDALLPEENTSPALSPEDRKDKILETIKLMFGRNTRGDFTGNGTPNARVLSGLVGFTVNNTERDVLWQEFLDAQNADK
jgi:hypothetical protein